MRSTYHLVPVDTWAAAAPGQPYAAPSLAAEGFIHCTDGAAEMVATANAHYRGDERDFLLLSVDLDAAGSPWRIEDERGIYPHVYGPIERRAILRVIAAPRGPDGAFLPFEPYGPDRITRPATGSRPNTDRAQRRS
jgi:uncharacterized protein (DUF952 family)